MDLLLLLSVSFIVTMLLLIAVRIGKLAYDERRTARLAAMLREDDRRQQQQERRERIPVIVGGRRRNVVNLTRRRQQQREEDDDDENERPGGTGETDDSAEEDDNSPLEIDLPEGKVGKKKMAKLQAKAERRANREAELQDREDRKKREQEKEEKRRKEEQKEKQAQLAREEIEKKELEERERREHEEYLKLKEAFQVEQEGFEQDESLQSGNLLQEFVEYVKNMKVVNMDELAAHFRLKTVEVVDRIKCLVADGILTGVIDDRGKFIYITPEELLSVAKFINQRGRVSVQELVEYSNTLIRLEPLAC